MSITSAISTYKNKALPHRYSTGGGFRFFFSTMALACVFGLTPKVKTGVPITVGLFCVARKIGKRQEQASVDTIAGLLCEDQDKVVFRQEITGLPKAKQLRITQLLQQRGIVV